MNYTEFGDADVSGLGPTEITVDNNPAPGLITLGGGRTVAYLESNQGILYVWDGDSAIKLEVEESIGLQTKYRLVAITQDATEFAALVDD